MWILIPEQIKKWSINTFCLFSQSWLLSCSSRSHPVVLSLPRLCLRVYVQEKELTASTNWQWPSSSAGLCNSWWTPWTAPLHTMYAASNLTTSNSLSCMYAWVFFFSSCFVCLISLLTPSLSLSLYLSHHLSAAGLILKERYNSYEPVVSWRQSASVLQATHPGKVLPLACSPSQRLQLCRLTEVDHNVI